MLGLSEKVYPGCQVLVAKNGKIIFHECYGNHTFDDSVTVKKGDLYDWASITKITGPLPLIMKFYENSILKLDVPFSNYWEDFKNSNKSDFTLREALTHQARLIPWIPFYAEPLELTRKNKKYFSDTPSEKYSSRVSSSLYMFTDYKKIIYKKIKESKLLSAKSYSYSDLCFILFPEVISNITGISYENFLNKEFLKPLGVKSVCYNPYRFYPKNMFIPTENDEIFRKELLCGFVHDETAAVLGGVSGNAGLFGTNKTLL
jgi:CubicO group peptidase (beta-lactamase class C family)